MSSATVEIENGETKTIPITVDIPNSYLPWSIINMVCGNLLFGLLGLIFSLKVRDKISEAQFDESKERFEEAKWRYAEAHKASRTAFILNLIGTILIALVWLLVILSYILAILLVAHLKDS